MNKKDKAIELIAKRLIVEVRNPHTPLIMAGLSGDNDVEPLKSIADVIEWSERDEAFREAIERLIELSADYVLSRTLRFVEEQICDDHLRIAVSGEGDATNSGIVLSGIEMLGAWYAGEGSWVEKYGKPR